MEVDKIIMDTVLVTFVNGVGTVTYDGKGYSKAICVANFMADAAYPSGYHNQLGVIAANGKINFYTHSTSNGKTYVAYILGLKNKHNYYHYVTFVNGIFSMLKRAVLAV